MKNIDYCLIDRTIDDIRKYDTSIDIYILTDDFTIQKYLIKKYNFIKYFKELPKTDRYKLENISNRATTLVESMIDIIIAIQATYYQLQIPSTFGLFINSMRNINTY
jgi:hypothetical protein